MGMGMKVKMKMMKISSHLQVVVVQAARYPR